MHLVDWSCHLCAARPIPVQRLDANVQVEYERHNTRDACTSYQIQCHREQSYAASNDIYYILFVDEDKQVYLVLPRTWDQCENHAGALCSACAASTDKYFTDNDDLHVCSPEKENIRQQYHLLPISVLVRSKGCFCGFPCIAHLKCREGYDTTGCATKRYEFAVHSWYLADAKLI